MPRSPLATVAPRNVDLLVAIKVDAAKVELDMLHPHDWTDLGIFDPGLFVEFAGNGDRTVFARIDATARNLKPRRL